MAYQSWGGRTRLAGTPYPAHGADESAADACCGADPELLDIDAGAKQRLSALDRCREHVISLDRLPGVRESSKDSTADVYVGSVE